eukprot:354169-Chlamydomonas_euryale.AAC.19
MVPAAASAAMLRSRRSGPLGRPEPRALQLLQRCALSRLSIPHSVPSELEREDSALDMLAARLSLSGGAGVRARIGGACSVPGAP